MLRRCCFSVITLLLTMIPAASVQAALSPADSAAAANASGQKVQEKAKAAKPKVIKFENLCTGKNNMRLGDYIQLTVENIDGLRKDPNDTAVFLPPMLFINDIPMKGIYAEYASLSPNAGKPNEGVLTFQIRRDSTNLKTWDVFYQSSDKWSNRKVRVTAGYDRTQVLASVASSEINKPELVLVRTGWIWGVALLILSLSIAFVVFAKKSYMLRIDFGTPVKVEKQLTTPYSLARSQLGTWTLVVLCCYLLVWLATGTLPPVTGSTLVLLGISLATLTGGKFIDTSRDAQQVKLISAKVSKGFFTDILSDEKGVSIHRFQMVAWTFVLMCYFVVHTLKNLSFPQLDNMLLLLMGISNGTYLGLKIPENVSEQPTTPDPAPVAVPTPQPSAEQVNALFKEEMDKFKQVVENANYDLRKQSVINLSHEVAAYLSIQQAEALKFFLANDTAVDQAKALLQRIAAGDVQEKEKAKTELATLFSSN